VTPANLKPALCIS